MATTEVSLLGEVPNVALFELCVLDASGDTRMQWDPNNPEEVAKAQARFNELVKQGYLAYSVNKKGDRGTVMASFDPTAERIILHAAMVGG